MCKVESVENVQALLQKSQITSQTFNLARLLAIYKRRRWIGTMHEFFGTFAIIGTQEGGIFLFD